MTYPTLPTEVSSERTPVNSRSIVRATNGSLKVRSLHPSEKYSFMLEHKLTVAQYGTLTTHYGSNTYGTFSYVWPGTAGGTHTVMYAARPDGQERGGWIHARVRLEEV